MDMPEKSPSGSGRRRKAAGSRARRGVSAGRRSGLLGLLSQARGKGESGARRAFFRDPDAGPGRGRKGESARGGPRGTAGAGQVGGAVSQSERRALRKLSSEAEGRRGRSDALAGFGFEGRVRSGGAARLRISARRKTWRFTRRFYVLVGLTLALILFFVLRATIGGNPSDVTQDKEAPATLTTADLNSLKVNEMGAVMVLRYGRIGEEGRESRSPENLRRDLQVLYQQGYRCVSISELVSGEIRTAPGCTPVVISFWGSDPGQVRFLEEGGTPELDPRCALGVLEDFGREHPDFGATAAFFLGKQLFGQEEFRREKLSLLEKRGYELGIAVEGEASRSKDPREALDAVADAVSAVRRYLPDFRPRYALLPQEWRDMAGEIGSGVPLDGETLVLEAIFYDGGRPLASPFDGAFDPYQLETVKVVDPSMDAGGLYHWLRYFSENPERKYVSDGDPSTVTVPRHMVFRVDAGKASGRRVRNY